MIRILVADDHAVVRQGVKQILADVTDMTVQDEAQNGPETLKKVTDNNYDVVLLDISMPGRSGLEVLEDIKAQHPKLAVLILSMHPEEQYAVRALRAGASGYLTKASAPQELIGAIRKVENMSRPRWPKNWPTSWKSTRKNCHMNVCPTASTRLCSCWRKESPFPISPTNYA